uniref:Glycosyltransferase n=2 Tax=Providencia alcalifaciens TaxID=126385 RepID=H9XTT0_9GAMM|nr:glycosyltransferase [Providencia alcalifaciens]
MLFIGVCCTEYDFDKNLRGLAESITSIKKAFSNEVFIFGVIQKKESSKFSPSSIILKSIFNEYIITHEFGVSCSRNKIIEKALFYKDSFGINSLLFHDSSIRWNDRASNFIFANRKKPVYVKFKYCKNHENKAYRIALQKKDDRFETINILTNTYVGSYLLDINSIKDIRFNENFGPGEKTEYKSGEDVLFLNAYFNRNGIKKIKTCPSTFLFHPSRPTDYSKHLLYAKGQGRVFRLLLTEHFNYYYLYRFALFLSNGLLRCILCKKNSFTILKERLIGFLKG